jgi:Tfp pilus assembly protein FimT
MRRREGVTLAELAVVVVIAGIVAGLVLPPLAGVLATLRTRAATNQLAADLAYTRALALREGNRARLVIEPAAVCPAPSPGAAGTRYRLHAGESRRVVAERDLADRGGSLCVASNRSAEVTFNSRGVLVGHNNRTLSVRDRGYPADTLVLSAVGRILRRY